MDELVKSIDEKMATARLGGGPKAAERMRSKGKKLPRERCWMSSFLWLSTFDIHYCYIITLDSTFS